MCPPRSPSARTAHRVGWSWSHLGCLGVFGLEGVGAALGHLLHPLAYLPCEVLVPLALPLLLAPHLPPAEEVARDVAVGGPTEPHFSPASILARPPVAVARALLENAGELVGLGVGLGLLTLALEGGPLHPEEGGAESLGNALPVVRLAHG